MLCHCVRRLTVTVARGPCQTPVTVGRPVTVVDDFSRIYAPQCRVGRPGIRFFLARRFLGGSLLTSRIVAPSPTAWSSLARAMGFSSDTAPWS